MGSAAQDNQGNSAVGFSASSTSLFPSILWAGRLASDPPDSLAQGEASVVSGSGVADRIGEPMGRLQRADGGSVRRLHVLLHAGVLRQQQLVRLGTRVGELRVPGLHVLAARHRVRRRDELRHRHAGRRGARIGRPRARPGDRRGRAPTRWSFRPGPTRSRSRSRPTRRTAAPSVVANGGATTLDVCLNGSPLLAAAGATLAAESCLPPNGVPDPGEAVTIAFCIQNAGSADTSDLVGTLEATGGVVDPPAPADFGIVAAGGAPVCRDLSFTVDPALVCGANPRRDPRRFQDGASSLGSVVAPFQAGVPKPRLRAGLRRRDRSGAARRLERLECPSARLRCG